jgi:VWFA-related protein
VVKPAWVVLFVDNENLHPHHRARVLRRVREFVVESLHEPVRMMVVSSAPSLQVVQPFTTDSRQVNAALEGMKRLAGGRVERDNARRELVDRIEDVANQDYGAGARNTRDGSRVGIEQQIMAYAEEEANSLSFTLSALHQVISMMSGLDGSKSIVHVSSGLAMTPGIGLMHQYATTFHDTSILSRRSRVDRMSAYRSLGTAANAQDVRLYTIDASGLNPLEGFSAEDRYGMDPTASSIGMDDLQASLLYLAEATGGLAVVNTNDIGPGLGRIRDDLFSYYSLGYSLKSSGEDRVHEIKV